MMAYLQAPVHEVDIDRHGGEQAPLQPVPKPILGSGFSLDRDVIDGERPPEIQNPIYAQSLPNEKAFPIPGTKLLLARDYGMSLWGHTARIDTELPGGKKKSYFLKVNPACPCVVAGTALNRLTPKDCKPR